MNSFTLGFADELVKVAKAKAVEQLVGKALRSRAGLGAAAGATISGVTGDEGLIGDLTRGALVGGAAGWGLPKLMRARASKLLKNPKARKALIKKLRRQGHKVK